MKIRDLRLGAHTALTGRIVGLSIDDGTDTNTRLPDGVVAVDLLVDTAQQGALVDVVAERRRQDEKWGEQNHSDGTGPEIRPLLPHLRVNAVPPFAHARDLATAFTQETDANAGDGHVTWRDILLEEVFEALAEDDSAMLRTELVQIAAVALQWAEAIDRRA